MPWLTPKKIVDLWAKLKMFDGNFHEDGQEDRFMHLPAGSCSGSNETTVTLKMLSERIPRCLRRG